jgi:hypothetical protein
MSDAVETIIPAYIMGEARRLPVQRPGCVEVKDVELHTIRQQHRLATEAQKRG